MAFDIFDTLISILCPTSESARTCTNFVQQQSHQVLEPIGPLFYFLLFPSVFIILFIYFLSDFAIGEHKGLKILLSIAVYIFIVISGWYAIILPISEIWFIVTIIFIGIWIFLKRLFKGRGEPTGKMEGFASGMFDRIKSRAGFKIEKKLAQKLGVRTDSEKILDTIEKKLEKSDYNVDVLNETERLIASMRLGVPVSSIESKKLREMWEKSKS